MVHFMGGIMFEPNLFGRCTRVVVATALAAMTGCIPYHADQQSARLLEPGRVEVTPSFTAVSSEGAHVQNQLGVRAGYGLSTRTELRGMIERVSLADGGDDFEDDDSNVSVWTVAAGPKFAIVPNRVAFYLPVGLASGSGIETGKTLTTVPTLLASFSNNRTLEFTPSIKAILPLTAEEKELVVGLHLGAGISSNLDKWAVRPEFGILKNPGESGTVVGFTLGFSFRPGAK
jgi:hypothetical protein